MVPHVPELLLLGAFEYFLAFVGLSGKEETPAPSILLTGHFPAPTAGRVVSHGRAFRFQFED